MRTFCAKCGRQESKDSPLIQGLCANCFTSTKKIVQLPNSIEVFKCSSCGAIRSRRGKFSEVNLTEYVRDLVGDYIARGRVSEGVSRVKVSRVELQDDEAVVEVEGVVGETVLRQELRVRLITKSTTCPECRKYRSKSFEAVLQLRPGNSRASALVTRIVNDIYKYPGVVDIKESKEGVDLYIAEKSFATRIVRDLESSYITKVLSTWKGFKYAHRKPKAVYSVRVYEIERGDLIELEGSMYEVIEASPKAVVLRDLKSGGTLSFTLNNLWRQRPVIHEKG
ncbi:MAG: NMD3-related protein [Sulfolobales archaeon]